MPPSVTIFGFGAQGRAQALNALASGLKVRVHLRPHSPRIQEAKGDGLEVVADPKQAAAEASTAVVLLPDSAQPEFYETFLRPHLPKGAALVFAHGFNIHFKQIVPRPDLDCLLAAPCLAGSALRENFLNKEEVPILTAVHQDATDRAYRQVEEYAGAIGGERTKILPTTFKEETETDLFAEQAVICGGINALVKAAFETLVKAGYSPEIAYYSCLKEIKGTTAENLYRHGIQGFRRRISQTALYGDLTRGPRVINDQTAQEMKKILDEICSGKFTKELMTEKNAGWPNLNKRMEEEAAHPIEKVRAKIEK